MYSVTWQEGQCQSRSGGQELRLLIWRAVWGSRDSALAASLQPMSFACCGSMRSDIYNKLGSDSGILCFQQFTQRNGALRIARKLCQDESSHVRKRLRNSLQMGRQMFVLEELADRLYHITSPVKFANAA